MSPLVSSRWEPGAMTIFPLLIKCVSSSRVVRYALSDPWVDRYLEFVAGQARPNRLRRWRSRRDPHDPIGRDDEPPSKGGRRTKGAPPREVFGIRHTAQALQAAGEDTFAAEVAGHCAAAGWAAEELPAGVRGGAVGRTIV